jgi:hypothetical protein
MSGRLLPYVMPGADRHLMVANSSQDIKEFTSVCVGDVMTLEWTIVITIDDYQSVNWKRQFADRVMEAFGFTANQVCEIRATEGLIEIDQPALLFDDRDVLTCSIWPLNSKDNAFSPGC